MQVTFVNLPTSLWMSKASATRLELERPMPAPKPRERIQSFAVDVPSRQAHSMSGMPGPRSFAVIVIVSSEMSSTSTPPWEWMQMLISSS